MTKKYKNMWVYGNSNAVTNSWVSAEEIFWGLAAKQLGIEKVINFAYPGSSLNGTMHIFLSAQDEYDWENDFFLIGITDLERWTVFDNHKNTETLGKKFNTHTWEHEEFKIHCRTGLMDISFAEDKQTVIFNDRAWTEVLALKQIYFLQSLLDSKNASYLIFNLGKVFDKQNKWAPSDFLLPACLKHPRSLLFDKTYTTINIDVHKPFDFDLYQWAGHHGPAGNANFYSNVILPALVRNKFTNKN